ncbi:hypothetical protein ACFOEE_11545 [Pseudoalteromonas fenneropenaei]|uniref:Lipoprotein n=1 Tax=Pseudoalteromonas fenneropenaei TaxID=1737459 RepID=A0ABV7CKK6_9GAMM
MTLTRLLSSALLFSFLAGCATKPDEPKYRIVDEQFFQRAVDGGRTEFVFIVTVAATPHLRQAPNKPIGKSERKQIAEFERLEDSPALKIQLEEEAVGKLKQTLLDRKICRQGHSIDNVYWRERSVQLRGGCFE